MINDARLMHIRRDSSMSAAFTLVALHSGGSPLVILSVGGQTGGIQSFHCPYSSRQCPVAKDLLVYCSALQRNKRQLQWAIVPEMNNSKCQFLRSLVLKFKTDNSSAKQCECTILENESFRIECTTVLPLVINLVINASKMYHYF